MSGIVTAKTYHVNVDVGDCTVIVAHDAAGQPQKVVLIDGGKYVPGGKILKHFFVTYLPYVEPLLTTPIQVDTIIVTHWDEDHMGGIFQWLSHDLGGQFRNPHKPTDTELKDARCSFMKYDPDTTKPRTPLTTLYVPFTEAGAIVTVGPPRCLEFKGSASDDTLMMGFNVSQDQRPTARDEFIIVNNICKVRKGVAVMGVNFFTNSYGMGHTFGTRPDYTSPADMVGHFTDAIGLYGVASNGDCFAPASRLHLTKDAATAHGSSHSKRAHHTRHDGHHNSHVCHGHSESPANHVSVETHTQRSVAGPPPSPTPPKKITGGSIKIVNRNPKEGKADESNRASIAALLVRRNGVVSHYYAGDMLWPEETQLVAWIGRKCNAVKLSHHGAVTSSPEALFTTLDPNNIIISAGGYAGVRHGHPSFQLVLWLWAWSRQKDNLKSRKFLWSTCWPGYLRYQNDTQNFTIANTSRSFDDLTADNDRPKEDPVSVYQASLTSKWPAPVLASADAVPDIEDVNPVEQLRRITVDWNNRHAADPTTPELTTVDSLSRIYKTVQQKWAAMSDVEAKHDEAAVHYTWLASGITASEIECILVQHVDGAADGTTTLLPRTIGTIPDIMGIKSINASKPRGSYDVQLSWKELPKRRAAIQCNTKIVVKETAKVSAGAYRAWKKLSRANSDVGPYPRRALDEAKAHAEVELMLKNFSHGPAGARSGHVSARKLGSRFALPTGVDIILSSVMTSPGIVSVQSADPVDDFLMQLRTGSLIVAAQPDANGQLLFLDQNGAGDEWAGWMRTALGADSIKAYRTGSQTISGFSLTMGGQFPLEFSTAYTPPGFPDTYSKVAVNAGYVSSGGFLIMGLNSANPASAKPWALSDVLSFLGTDAQSLDWLAPSIQLNLEVDANNKPVNALWFWPTETYTTVVRLQFTLVDAQSLSQFVTSHFNGLKLSDPKLVARKRVFQSFEGSTYSILSESELIVSATLSTDSSNSTSFRAYLDFQLGGVTVRLRPLAAASVVDILNLVIAMIPAKIDSSAFDWISTALGWLDPDMAKGESRLHVLEIQFNLNKSGVQGFSITLEYDASFGNAKDGPENVAFLMKIAWSKNGPSAFTGQIWTPLPPMTDPFLPLEILPDYEEYLELQPRITDPSEVLNLFNLIPGQVIEHLPSELDVEIAAASISVSSSGEMVLSGTIYPNDSDSDDNKTGFTLFQTTLEATYDFKADDHPFTIHLQAEALIQAPDAKDNALFVASLDYDATDKTWTASAELDNLSMRTLYSFFPNGEADAVMDILDHITLLQVGVLYKYTSGVGSYFFIDASLAIDVFRLTLSFERDVQADWTFKAILDAAPGVDTTLKNLVGAAIKDQAVVDLIPEFLNFKIASDDTAGDGSNLELFMKKIQYSSIPGTTTSYIFSALAATLKPSGDGPSLSFSLIQLQQVTDASSTTPAKGPTRLFRVALEGIPFDALPNVPLIGKLSQPFRGLEYVWVHGPDNKGLTRPIVAVINQGLTAATLEVLNVKDNAPPPKPGQSPSPTDILLAAGSHFIVLEENPANKALPLVMLDYVFGRPAAGQQPSGGGSGNKTVRAHRLQSDSDAEEPSGDTVMAKSSKTIGPLTISNFGIRFSDSTLHMVIDARVFLEPLGFSLLGFGVSLQFTGGVSLRNLASAKLGLDLSGLALSYQQDPLSIAGSFRNLSTPDGAHFEGAVIITYEPYSFMAVGAYWEKTKDDGSKFKSVFMFGKLEGPLIEFEFAELRGISLGFGYNSLLRYPTVNDIPNFPLTADTYGSPGSDPLDLLARINNLGWTTPVEGPIWVAFGLEMLAVQVVNVQAVVILQFDPYIGFCILGTGRTVMPAMEGEEPPRDECYVWVEIDIEATVAVHSGIARLEAQIAPNSFLMNPASTLNGGFALCYWYQGSGHDGDWVFTVGGYHPAYTKPDHYPNPARLGMNWQVNPMTSIRGEVYFAINPKVAMGGAYLQLTFSAGPLSAWLNAHADFLVNFSPFHFWGDVGVTVGVAFTLDLWIVTIHISVDINASLHIEGPPFGGYVHVDFWVFGFDINFGANLDKPPALSLDDFYKLLLQQQLSGELPSSSTPAAATNALMVEHPKSRALTAPPPPAPANDHVLAVKAGRFAPPKTTDMTVPDGQPWIVRRSGFVFSVRSRFAVFTATNNNLPQPPVTGPYIYSRPMHLVANENDRDHDDHITSTLSITVKNNKPGESIGEFSLAPIMQNVPVAMWGSYDSSSDPLLPSTSVQDTLGNADKEKTVSMLMGITLTAPPPYLSHDTILPFDAHAAMSEPVFTTDSTPNLPAKVDSASTEFNPQPLVPHGDDTDQGAPWKKVRNTWNGGSDDKATAARLAQLGDIVTGWTAAMGWDQRTDDKDLWVPLQGSVPQSLVVDLEKWYMSAPFVGVASS